MLNINLTSKLSSTVIGLLIFFVPFFTYLSPSNLRRLSSSEILLTLLSLIIILIVISISLFFIQMLLKRFFIKRIMLFPIVCFAFYLNFLYMPFLGFIQETFDLQENFYKLQILIYFEILCLVIIFFGAKFNIFSVRLVFIFSIFMLISSFVPLTSYLFDNIEKELTNSYELKGDHTIQDIGLSRHNVYFVILDGMMSIETASQFNVANKKEILDNLSNTGLKYIDKSFSSYNRSMLSLASIMLMDYHYEPNSEKYTDDRNLYPRMMYRSMPELPLISYLKKANSSLVWLGNSIPGMWCEKERIELDQKPYLSCINAESNFFSENLVNFYSTTPMNLIYNHIFDNKYKTQDSIGGFLKYIDKNNIPNKPFFAFIHHGSPHHPFLVTNECEPTNYFKNSKQNFEGYKASYHCTLKNIKMFMEKINIIDPEAIVIFQGDHGPSTSYKTPTFDVTEKEGNLLEAKIFNAIKAPKICFEKYKPPKTNVNTIRFVLNCAYGFKLPYRKNIHYEGFDEGDLYGTVIERKIY